MTTIEQLVFEVSELKRKMANVCRMVKVTAVDTETLTVSVQINPDVVIPNIPFVTRRASNNKTWWLPEVDETGLLWCPNGDVANGIFLAGINTMANTPPVDTTDAAATTQEVTEWSDGDREVHDYGTNSHELTSGDSIRTHDREKIKIAHNTQSVEVNADKIIAQTGQASVEVTPTEVKGAFGMNAETLNAIAKNILGGMIFNTGITTFMTPMGPVLFTPTPDTPSTPPALPTGTPVNADGEPTGSPPTNINNVVVRATSSLQLTIAALPVATPAGPGTVTAGTYPVTVTGTLQLTLPTRSF